MGLKNRFRIPAFFFLVSLVIIPAVSPIHGQEERLKLTSTAFSYFGNLPLRYTCSGLNVSPPLGWINVPRGCKSLALVVVNNDDSTINWLVWNINPSLKGFPEGVDVSMLGATTGKNDKGTTGYDGPCSMEGKAKYSVILYALRDSLSLKAGADKQLFYSAISRSVIEECSFVFFSGKSHER